MLVYRSKSNDGAREGPQWLGDSDDVHSCAAFMLLLSWNLLCVYEFVNKSVNRIGVAH